MKLKAFAVIAVMLAATPASVLAQTYNWTTIAGVAGSVGTADGTNNEARFGYLWGITLDRDGNLFVVENYNHTIRKVAPVGTNWVVTTIAGLAEVSGSLDGLGAQARFRWPGGIEVGPDGNLYVCDSGNATIRKLSISGTNWLVTTIAGRAEYCYSVDGTNTDALFVDPAGIASDRAGNLYVADLAGYRLRQLTPVGTNWVTTTVAVVCQPAGLTVADDGSLFVADFSCGLVHKAVREGAGWSLSTIAGNTDYYLGVADGTNTGASFGSLSDVERDILGHLFVCDLNNTIRRIVPRGTNWVVSTIGGLGHSGGSADGTNSAARFRWPSGVALDPQGRVFVADRGNGTIRLGIPVPMVDFVAARVNPNIDRQTGLFFQQIVVTNITPNTLTGLRVSVTNLPTGVQFVSATSTNPVSGTPFTEFTSSLAPGQSLTLTLAYYSSTREAPATTGVSVEAVTPIASVASTGEAVTIRRAFFRPDGYVAVEFDSLSSRQYAVQYSTDLSLWAQAQPLVPGNGGRMIWVDTGPPVTDSAPSTNRFYRIVRLPQ